MSNNKFVSVSVVSGKKTKGATSGEEFYHET